MLKELKREQDQVVLFIDELHNVVGAGRSEGSMDAGNMLKPALARGELHCVGATTLNEYREYIEKDAALERRFQKIMVDEPGEEETVAILRGLRERYEVHHGVNITDPAIIAAVRLSRRYITDRNLPDKAIDLVDEAASRIRMEIDSKPEPLDRLERRLVQLKIEREAIRRDKDQASRTQLEELEQEISGAEKEYRALEKVWESEKERLRGAQQLKEELEQVRSDLESAQRTADLGRVAELQHGVIPELEQKLQEAEKGAAAKSELCATRLPRRRLRRWSRAGPVCRWSGCWRGSGKNYCAWRKYCTSGWWDRMKRCLLLPMRCVGPGPGWRMPGDQTAPSCFSAPPVSARPSCAGRWPISSLTATRRLCALTCRSSWSGTQYRA